MDKTLLLKALADETRMKIVTLLLQHNYCVRALARKLEISEAAISQHLKVLREAGLLMGERKGYFMHYDVNRVVLHQLAREIDALAEIERATCSPEQGGCQGKEAANCHNHRNRGACSENGQEHCHGREHAGGPCQCHHVSL